MAAPSTRTWAGPPAFFWLAAFFFALGLALGYVAYEQNGEIARSASDRGAVEEDAQKRIADLQHQLVQLKAARTRADRQAARQAPKGAGANAKDGRTTVHVSDIIKDNPEYAAIQEKQQRRNIIRQYGEALNTLNLPPDKLARMKDLLVERQMAFSDTYQAAQAAGEDMTSPGLQAMVRQTTQDLEQQMTALLGDNGKAVLQQLQFQSTYQMQIQNQLEPDLVDAGIPLSDEQSGKLAQLIAAATLNQSSRPPASTQPDPGNGLSPYDNWILTNAAAVLTPDQLQVLKAGQIDRARQGAIMGEYVKGGGMFRIVP